MNAIWRHQARMSYGNKPIPTMIPCKSIYNQPWAPISIQAHEKINVVSLLYWPLITDKDHQELI